jgi:hypothetical protein
MARYPTTLVRDALQLAIAKLRVPEDVEEPSEADRQANLELDHDTKGETGWTDIADSIFKKIDAFSVFVANVTRKIYRRRLGDVQRSANGRSDISDCYDL